MLAGNLSWGPHFGRSGAVSGGSLAPTWRVWSHFGSFCASLSDFGRSFWCFFRLVGNMMFQGSFLGGSWGLSPPLKIIVWYKDY